MENPYDLFLALLAPKVWGGVRIPVRFAEPFKNALLESIDSEYQNYDDIKYVTGQITSERFRTSIEQLINPVLAHIEQQYVGAYNCDLEITELPILVRSGQSFQLSRCDDAKRSDEYFRMFEPEYAGIKERFPANFAALVDPATPSQVLYSMGQISRDDYFLARETV